MARSQRRVTAALLVALAIVVSGLAAVSPVSARTGRHQRPHLVGPAGAFTVVIDDGETRAYGAQVDVALPDPPAGQNEVRLSNDATHWSDAMAWAAHIAWNLIDPATGGVDESGTKTVSVQWRADGAWEDVGSDDIVYWNGTPWVGPFTLGDGSGVSHQWVVDINGGGASDPGGLEGIRVSLDGETWSKLYRFSDDDRLEWVDLRNMSLGGGWALGTRTVWMKVSNQYGGSTTRTATIDLVDMDTRDEKVRFAFPRPAVTGELFTIKVIYADGLRPPRDQHCVWQLRWGSLEGVYDEDFRQVHMERPVTGNECDEWTFTLPWSPLLKYQWRFDVVQLNTLDGWNSTPNTWAEITTFRATEGTRELGIPESSVRLAWLLPDKDVAQIGESITYRLFTSHPVGGGDAWDPEDGYFHAAPLIDVNDGVHQEGGRSFTYAPHLPGQWLTGWYWTPPGGWRDGLTRMLFDPIADGKKPRVTVRGVERQDGGSATIPYRLRWTGMDPATIPSSRPRKVVPGSGIARFQLQVSHLGAPWKTIRTLGKDARSVVVQVPATGGTGYRIRARDRAGNWSTWETWATIRPR